MGRWLNVRLVQNVLALEKFLQHFRTGRKNLDIAVIYRRDKGISSFYYSSA